MNNFSKYNVIVADTLLVKLVIIVFYVMLSKLRRSKSSVSDPIPERGLTGMPALKQRRSSQRQVQLSPGFLPARSKADCKSKTLIG